MRWNCIAGSIFRQLQRTMCGLYCEVVHPGSMLTDRVRRDQVLEHQERVAATYTGAEGLTQGFGKGPRNQ